MTITATAGFEIVSTIIGDRSVTLKWVYGSNIDESKIIKIMAFMNDNTVTSISMPNNLSWSASDISFSSIALKNTTISNLVDGERMMFYLAVIVNNNGDIQTKYSSLYGPVDIISAPNQFSIIENDGRDFLEIGAYNVDVSYSGITNPNPDKIVFMLLNSDTTPGNIIYEFNDDVSYNPVTNSTRFKLTNLSEDYTYEITGFLIRNGLTSPLSNTRWIISTQKTTPPLKPYDITFDYEIGSITMSTTINYGGVHGNVDLILYPVISNEVLEQALASHNISVGLYGEDGTDENFPFHTQNTYTHTNNGFQYATEYNVIYKTFTANIGYSSLSMGNVSDSIWLLKRPEAPIIDLCDSGDGYVNLVWHNTELYSSLVAKYEVEIVNLDTSANTVHHYLNTSANIINNEDDTFRLVNNITGLNNGQEYSLRVRAVVDDKNDSGEYIAGVWSDAQFARPFTIPLPMTFAILNQTENNTSPADESAYMSWNIPTLGIDTGYLPINHFEVWKAIEDGEFSLLRDNLASNVSNFTDVSLNNGTVYKYQVRIITVTTNYNNILDVNGQFSAVKQIIPWSIPNKPTVELDNSVYPQVGNHYIRIKITDNTVSTNGLQTTLDNTTYYITSTNGLIDLTIPAESLTTTYYRINNIENDVDYVITVVGQYRDPNMGYTYLSESSNSVTARPTYTDSMFSPYDMYVSTIGNQTAQINWAAPELADASLGERYNLSLTNYEVNIYIDNTIVDALTVTVPLHLVQENRVYEYKYETGTGLMNGTTYTAKVRAIYDDLSIPGTQTVYSSNSSANFIPFTTYPINNLVLNDITNGVANISWSIDDSDNGNEDYVSEFSFIIIDSSNESMTLPLFGNGTSMGLGGYYGEELSIKIQSTFVDPNNSSHIIYVESDSISVTTYVIPNALELSQNSLDNNSVTLSWSAPNMNGLPFEYVVHMLDTIEDSSGDIIVSQNDTSLDVSGGLLLGHTYYFSITVRFTDPNQLVGSAPNYYVVNTTSEILSVTPFLHPTVGDLTGVASSQRVDLSFNTFETIGGLPVDRYLYGIKPYGGSYSYVDVGANPSMPIAVTGLSNGISYSFKFYVKTDNNVNPDEYGDLLESASSNEITLKPFTNPDAVNDLSIDTASGNSIGLTWSTPGNLGGMSLYGFDIEESLNNTSNWIRIQENYSGNSIAIARSAYGTQYYYRVLTKTQNSNLPGIVLVPSLLHSNEVNKILFEAPKPVTELELISVEDASVNTIVLESTYTESIGLLNPTFKVTYFRSGVSLLVARTAVADADLVDGKYRYTITDFDGGYVYNASVRMEGNNPNLPGLAAGLLTSTAQTIEFGAFDSPVLGEFYVTEIGDRSISLTLNGSGTGLNLNFTNFSTYNVEFYDSSDNTLVGSKLFSAIVVNNVKVERLDNGVPLVNGVEYRLQATAYTLNPVDTAIILSSNTPQVFATPQSNLVPTITSGPTYVDNSMNLVVDSKGMDILDYVLFVAPIDRNDVSGNAVLYYKLQNVIPVAILDTSTTITIPLVNIIPDEISSIIFIIKNANGWSDVYFAPDSPTNLFKVPVAPPN
jgi:hypothetical protein